MPNAGAARPSGAKGRAAIDEATEPDDGVPYLLEAMRDVLPDEPMNLGQNTSPAMNMADLVQALEVHVDSRPRCPGNHNSVYAPRRPRPCLR